MFTNTLSFKNLLMILILPLLTGGCAIFEKLPDPSMQRTYHAKVSGSPTQLKMFDDKLKQIVGATNLEDAFIACDNCDDLASTPPPDHLDYYFYAEHSGKPKKFSRAWYEVQRAQTEPPLMKTFSLTFDGEKVPGSPACPPSPPAPSGCVPAALCTATDQCDRYKNIPNCQKCAY